MGQQLKYNILLADDHAIIRNGLEFLISTLKKSISFFNASNKSCLLYTSDAADE